jgi:hypothetical protein
MPNTEHDMTYRFGPLERMGFMLGLRVPQLAGMVFALLIGLGFLQSGGFGGLALASGVVCLAAGVFLKAVRGHTLEEWTPLVLRFLGGRLSGRARFRAQLAQLGHVARVPAGGMAPQSPGEPKALPAELAKLEFLEGACWRATATRGLV